MLFCVDPLFLFEAFFSLFVYILYTLGRFLDVPFIFNILLFIHQKNKK